ncbi:RING-H2 finger protein ATL74-like isoform X1 [Olea europaea var. sylvestris]|uniref:RING-H2 finger protein ATL74-like isoform X1 n=1 Tax=Olea europaea var. sylvestris TaxID=158386 RepID=UPI000C1D7C41|nr:RING-H2 finger protein ATL74-like isoform X1 [Olea europaea var. sylvestris]XP_022873817.1 RING-H2 finger protein ATL74-like isoform X1 [Olea europaea var. sylvestris]
MSLYHEPRRFLLDKQPVSNTSARPHNGKNGEANFDTNMVIILAALLCALICALGINSIVRCILRCSNRLTLDATDQTPPRGVARKGLKKRTLRQIPVAEYGSGHDNAAAFTDCPICLGEFMDGEKVRVLPYCHHCFHVKCIDIWLASHSSCPTCRQSLEDQPTDAEADGRQGGNAAGEHGDLPSFADEAC